MKKGSRTCIPLASFSEGRDENNLAEFPIALLSDAAAPNQKTIEFEDTLEDFGTGRTIVRRVCITGSDKFGLPTAKDEQVLMGLIQLTKIANNFTEPEVGFVKRDIIEILGWENRGWSYDRVEESLHRWKGVSIHYWNAWRDNASGTWRDSAAVGVIDYFTLSDGRFRIASDGEPTGNGQSVFCWNKLFFESFQSGYLKKLDFATYRNLRGAAAKRAYRFLDKRFFHKQHWQFDLRQFACEKLGFSRAYTTGQLKERVRPVLGELEEIGFIEPHSLKKERPKIWTLAVTKKESATTIPEQSQVESNTVARELVARGVNRKVATKLCQCYSPTLIESKIAVFEWLLAQNDKRTPKRPAGFLVDSIRSDYPPPADYLKAISRKPSVEREKRAPSNPTKQVQIKPKDNIERYLDKLAEAESEQLLVEALDGASRVERSSLLRLRQQGSSLYREVRRNVLRKHITATAQTAINAMES